MSRISLSVTTMDDVFLKIGEMLHAKVSIPLITIPADYLQRKIALICFEDDGEVGGGGGGGGAAAWTSDPEAETRSVFKTQDIINSSQLPSRKEENGTFGIGSILMFLLNQAKQHKRA